MEERDRTNTPPQGGESGVGATIVPPPPPGGKPPGLWYILEPDNTVREVASGQEWVRWFSWAHGSGRTRVARDDLHDAQANTTVTVSTVFLGVNTGITPASELFETHVFGGTYDRMAEKSDTWAEAERQHRLICAMVTGTDLFDGDEGEGGR